MKWLQGYKGAKKFIAPPLDSGTEHNFVMPVYLNADNFDFSKCKPDGSDISFTDPSLNPLKFERVEHSYISVGYNQGNECVVVTGGWTSTYINSDGVATKETAKLSVAGSGMYSTAGFKTTNMLNMSLYKKIRVRVTDCSKTGAGDNSIRVANTASGVESPVVNVSLNATGTYELDVSGLSGNYYLSILSQSGSSGSASMKIDYVELEVRNPFAHYNVLLPTVSDIQDTDFYMWYGNPNAYNDSIEAWQDKTGKQLTYNGNVKLVPNVAKFGKAAYFDGAGDYIDIPYSSDFDFGTGDFTVDMWLDHATNPTGTYSIFEIGNYTSNIGLLLQINSAGKFYVWCNGGAGNNFNTTVTAPLGKLYHLELYRSSGVVYLRLDGIVIGSVTCTSAIAGNSSYGLRIGNSFYTPTQYYLGYMDEFRISKGIARHTTNFTPSQTPFVADQYTKLLLHFDDFDAMRIATSTTGTDYCAYYTSGAVVNSTKTTVAEAMLTVETNGSTRGQYLAIYNGSKMASIDFRTTGIVCNSYGTAPYTYAMTTTVEHTYSIELQNTLQAVFRVDGVIVHTASYANLYTTTNNLILFGDGDNGINIGGSAVWKSVKYNLDYVANPLTFIEWKPLQGVPTATGWLLSGTSTLASMLFKDETGKAVYTNGDVKPIKTAYADGARGAVLDGNGDYFTVPYGTEFSFGSGDFCFETEFQLNAVGIIQTLCMQGNSTAGSLADMNYQWVINATNKLTFNFVSGSTGYAVTYDTALIIGMNYKAKAYRQGNTLVLVVNNVNVSSISTLSTISMNSLTVPFTIGRYGDYNGYFFNGNMKGLRVTKGRSRSAEAFPTKFDIDGDDVVFCTNFDTIYDQNYAMVQHMGDSLVDATGNGNNGTATGTTVVDTEFGKARLFDGVDDMISITSATAFATGTSDMTLTVLVEQMSLGTNDGLVATCGNTSSIGFFLAESNGADKYEALSGTGSAYDAYPVSPNIIPNDFEVIGIRRKANLFAIIDDGVSVSSATTTKSYTSTEMKIGRRYVDIANYYGHYQIAELRYSDRFARSDAWIKAESLGLKNELLTVKDVRKGNPLFGFNF